MAVLTMNSNLSNYEEQIRQDLYKLRQKMGGESQKVAPPLYLPSIPGFSLQGPSKSRSLGQAAIQEDHKYLQGHSSLGNTGSSRLKLSRSRANSSRTSVTPLMEKVVPPKVGLTVYGHNSSHPHALPACDNAK